jgi:hypothetical protein
VAASELYNTRSEALLIERVGVAYADAADTAPGKRPVREILGVPTELTELWSSRRSAIEQRVGQLAKAFQTEHGREPSVVEMLAISQQATLQTRQAKHEPRSLAEQRHTWRTHAVEVVGSQHKLSKLIADITGQTTARRRTAITGTWVSEQAATVLANVAETRSTWQVNHIRAEAQRLLRYLDHPGGPEVVNRIVTTALSEHSIALTTQADTEMGEPVALRRRDGESVYTGHGSAVYTSAQVMAAERRILAAAAKRGGRVVDDTSIGLALLEAHAQHGFELNDDQQQLVKTMATSGARLQLALAPAGTGKTTAMGALAAAWANSGGTVIGLAPTASAAEVLAEDTGVTTDTMAKFVQLAQPADRRTGPPPAPDDPARKWFNTIGSNTLLIVDEAGKASTFDLDAVIGHAMARGASVRLVGDDQQLATISAGGVISDLAARHETLTLSTVVRFADPGESAASLAMREGDPAGIAYYIDHRRVHVGADQNAADMAYAAWAADIAAGRDSILLAPTNDQVAELNERARLDRLTNGGSASATVTLGDGLTASAGDWIATRKNARWLRLKASNGWVKNGHRWVIRRVNRDGSVTVSPLRGRAKDKTVRLPADYLAAHTTLGYASTIDSAQGITAGGRDIDGTCHIVGSDRLTRQQLYVAGTRGKNGNHIYFSTAESDPHRILAPKATHPPPQSTSSRRSCAATAHKCPPTAPRPPNPIRSPGCTPRPPCTPTHSPRPPNTPPARPRWPTSTPRRPRSAPTSPTTPPGRCCGAAWLCWPSTATTRSRPYTRPPPPPWETPLTSQRCSTGAYNHRRGRPPSGSVRCAGWRPSPTRWPPTRNGAPTWMRARSSSASWPIRSASQRANGSPAPSRPGHAPCWLSNPS